MSFIITRTSIPVKRYPELCNATMSAEAETLQVTVTVEYLESLNGQYGTICYSMQPEGGSKGTGMFEFFYSGTGSPLEEAEAALLRSLQPPTEADPN